MGENSPPSFDEWVDWCFEQGHDNEALEARFDLEPTVLVQYTVRLFEAPEFIADRYTDEAIAQATWYLFGVESSYGLTVTTEAVDSALQIRWMRSVGPLYVNLFDHICNGGRRETEDAHSDGWVDTAVYMIWDMDCGVSAAIRRPESTRYLVDPAFEVLERVLTECLTGACIQSALHGLGHLQRDHPERVETVIDAFLVRRAELPGWLLEYAHQARAGNVQ